MKCRQATDRERIENNGIEDDRGSGKRTEAKTEKLQKLLKTWNN